MAGAKKKAATRRTPQKRTGVPLFLYIPKELRDRLEGYREREAAGLSPSMRAKFTMSDAVRDLLEKGLGCTGHPDTKQ